MRKRLSEAIAAKEENYVTGALIQALGRLEPPSSSVPLLVSLLGQAGTGDSAAGALGSIGKPAIAALPSLIERLRSPDLGWRERISIISALTAIDGASPDVQRALLREATSGDYSMGTMSAAEALANIDPLPSDFAPRLLEAAESLDSGTTRGALQQALYHTHTGISADGSRQPAPPVHIDNDLKDAVWALTMQPGAMTLDAVFQYLRIERDDYDVDGGGESGEVMIRGSSAKPSRAANPITMIMLSPVLGQYDGKFNQNLRVTFNRRFCLSADAITDHVIGSGNRWVNSPDGMGGWFKIDGGHASEKSAALDSLLIVGAGCGGQIEVDKHFDPEYWRARCPFTYSQNFVDNQIIPGLKSSYGTGFSAYDLSAPKIEDHGRYVQLTYQQASAMSAGHVGQSPRLSVEIDRCGQRQFSRAWDYWP